MTDHPLVCGVDYSTRQLDVAVVQGRQLVSVERHALGVDLPVQVGVICRLSMDLARRGVVVLVMEQRWTRVEKGLTSALAIRDVSTRLEALAIAAGLKVSYVPVNTWRAVVLGNGGLKTDAAKREAVQYVERVYGTKVESHNAADAVCIASWGASTLRLHEGRRLAHAG